MTSDCRKWCKSLSLKHSWSVQYVVITTTDTTNHSYVTDGRKAKACHNLHNEWQKQGRSFSVGFEKLWKPPQYGGRSRRTLPEFCFKFNIKICIFYTFRNTLNYLVNGFAQITRDPGEKLAPTPKLLCGLVTANQWTHWFVWLNSLHAVLSTLPVTKMAEMVQSCQRQE